jgi:hypothetical protein
LCVGRLVRALEFEPSELLVLCVSFMVRALQFELPFLDLFEQYSLLVLNKPRVPKNR